MQCNQGDRGFFFNALAPILELGALLRVRGHGVLGLGVRVAADAATRTPKPAPLPILDFGALLSVRGHDFLGQFGGFR